jgi:dipeptidyl aminopeptidase/acylaminoacyl peptidase
MSERGRANFEEQSANRAETLRKKISPISYVTADAPPMLLWHEESDRTVGVYQSDTFISAMREAGAKDVNYVLFGDGTGHGTFQRNIAVTEPMREAFFARTLKHKQD